MQRLLETSSIQWPRPKTFRRVVMLALKHSSKEELYISKLSCFFQITILSAIYILNFLYCDSPSLLQQLFRNLLLDLSRQSFLPP